MSESFSNICLRYGSKKHSKASGYADIYEKILEHRTKENLRILEFGDEDPNSILAWLEYLPNAEVVFATDESVITRHLESVNRTRLSICSTEQLLSSYFSNRNLKFDLVVDNNPQNASGRFRMLLLGLESVNPEGFWCIENTFLYVMDSKLVDFYKVLFNWIAVQQAEGVFHRDFYTSRQLGKYSTYLSRNIFGIRSYKSMVVLEKARG